MVRIVSAPLVLVQTNFTDWLTKYLDDYYEWLDFNEGQVTPADIIELDALEHTLREWNLQGFHPVAYSG